MDQLPFELQTSILQKLKYGELVVASMVNKSWETCYKHIYQQMKTTPPGWAKMAQVFAAIDAGNEALIQGWLDSKPTSWLQDEQERAHVTGYRRYRTSEDRWSVLAWACRTCPNPRVIRLLATVSNEECPKELREYLARSHRERPYQRNDEDDQDQVSDDPAGDSGGDADRKAEKERREKEKFLKGPCFLVDYPINSDSPADHYSYEAGHRHPLHIAAEYLNLAAVKILVESGAFIDQPCYFKHRGSTALHIAVMKAAKQPEKAYPIIRYLVSKNANCWGVVDGGFNPLHTACRKGLDTSIIELLVTKYPKADYGATDYRGASFYCFSDATALHYALKCPRTPLSTMKLLIERDKGRLTTKRTRSYNCILYPLPIHMATYFTPQRFDIIEYLVAAGTPINVQMDGTSNASKERGGFEVNTGDTALHMLAKNKEWENYAKLRALGADDSIRNVTGTTPKQLYERHLASSVGK